jgi:hypothetical protein
MIIYIYLYTVFHFQHLPGFYRRRVHPSEAFRAASTSDSSLSSSKRSPQVRMEADEAAIEAAMPWGALQNSSKPMTCMSCMSCMSCTCHTYVSIWMYLWQTGTWYKHIFSTNSKYFLYWKLFEAAWMAARSLSSSSKMCWITELSVLLCMSTTEVNADFDEALVSI